MEVRMLIERYPRLWHMAEDGAWPSIQRYGLLSTSALLDLYGINGRERDAIESEHRPKSIEIHRQGLDRAVVRDQKPMSDVGLARCLRDGLTPQEWYRILNTKTFFWLTEQRLSTLLNARPYRELAHTVLSVDTATLVGTHETNIRLSPMNSGCTKPFPHPRGRSTFLPISEYPFDERRNRGADAIVELAIEGSIPDIAMHVISVQRMRGTVILESIFER
jgi:hypothetical protein